MNSTVACSLLAIAVIATAPSPTPRTRPDASTVATETSLDDQLNSAPATAWPLASVASAERRSVSPTDTLSMAGNTSTAATFCVTVMAALPDAVPRGSVDRGGSVALRSHQSGPVHHRHPGVAARPGHRGTGHRLAVLVADLGAQLHGRVQRRQFGRGAGDTVIAAGRGGSGGGGSVVSSPQPEAQALAPSTIDARMNARKRISATSLRGETALKP